MGIMRYSVRWRKRWLHVCVLEKRRLRVCKIESIMKVVRWCVIGKLAVLYVESEAWNMGAHVPAACQWKITTCTCCVRMCRTYIYVFSRCGSYVKVNESKMRVSGNPVTHIWVWRAYQLHGTSEVYKTTHPANTAIKLRHTGKKKIAISLCFPRNYFVDTLFIQLF